MKTFVQPGDILTFTVPSATTIAAGDLVAVGAFVGVAATGGTTGEKITVHLAGVYTVPKATGAIAAGDVLYFDESEGEVTKTSAGNLPIGYAFGGAESGDATVNVKLAFIPRIEIELGDIAQGGATNGQVLKWNNTSGTWAPAADAIA
jgi:predicted RecA/RadA family phage recombinase